MPFGKVGIVVMRRLKGSAEADEKGIIDAADLGVVNIDRMLLL
jgi:hypothetical protein